jgi:hypothetical protein
MKSFCQASYSCLHAEAATAEARVCGEAAVLVAAP